MTERPQTSLLFQPEGSVFQQITLRCGADCTVDDTITAYVLGIEIGRRHIVGQFRAGETIGLPVRYLPLVDLPATIRLSSEKGCIADGTEIPVRSADDAVRLVGPGTVVVERLQFSQGLLRGFAVNRVNGLNTPVLFARINRLATRQVTMDRPRLLDDGGCSFGFVVQLYPTDLGENGFNVDLHIVGDEAPLASFQYARADGDDATRKLLELEGRLAQMQQMTTLQIAALNSDFRRRMDAQQERIDAFIDYASCLLFDQVASDAIAGAGGAALEPDPAMRQKIDSFREMIAAATRKGKPAQGAPRLARTLQVTPRAENFSFGWYDVETDPRGSFRWMGQSGMVLNPAPTRALRGLCIALRHLFKTERPMLRVFLDTAEVEARIEAAGPPHVFNVLIEQPKDGAPLGAFQTVRIESFIAGRPADEDNGTDQRLLSIAVGEVVFTYADGEDSVQVVGES
ncbi:hypothetical protein ACFOD4_12825 [Pseudoroseomonas globiformis]|uniref:Uncharacterized protein n=1 Tax=Teichococcus globiformis TaxID=2307229 RepID=A0ABV7G3D7_9PROT